MTTTLTSGFKVQIGEHGFIELYDYYPRVGELVDLDREITAAARVSYAGQNKTAEEDYRLEKYLISHKHDSPLEMVDITVIVNAPLVVWWQWVRHRLFSLNFQSGRYTPFEEDKVLVPQPHEWRLQSGTNKQGSEGTLPVTDGEIFTRRISDLYDECFSLYNDMLEKGVAREQARLTLPGFSVYYKARVKANLRGWLHWLGLRQAANAQKEIQDYAEGMHTILSGLVPNAVEFYMKERV